jgi:hypothetical protein
MSTCCEIFKTFHTFPARRMTEVSIEARKAAKRAGTK